MGQSASKLQSLRNSISFLESTNSKLIGEREIGVGLVTAYHYFICRIVKNSGIQIPPVLVSVLSTLVSLGVIRVIKGKETTDNIILFFEPSVNWLGNWMTLWLCPPLVVLPNALMTVKGSSASCWIKLALVHFISWIITMIGASKIYRILNKDGNIFLNRHSNSIIEDSPPVILDPNAAQNLRRKKQIQLLKFWGAVAVGFYTASCVGVCPPAPALASTSIVALAGGNLLPTHIKKVIHPLFTAAVISGVSSIVLYKIRQSPNTWQQSLCSYFSSGKSQEFTPGDLFFSLLGPSCTALAFRIFALAPEISEFLPAIVATSAGTAILSLFGSPLLGKLLGLPEQLNNVLAHRSITTPFALPSAVTLEASPELTVAAVLITGLYGASGQWLLDWLDVNDRIESGVTLGMASHSIGTATLMSQSATAAAAASMAMFSAGIVHSLCCAVPGIRQAVKSCASSLTP